MHRGKPEMQGEKMKNEKTYGAMVRLDERTYFELRKLALDQRSTFNRLAREVLEGYLKQHKNAKPNDMNRAQA